MKTSRSYFSIAAAMILASVAFVVALPARAVALVADVFDAVLTSLDPRAVIAALRLDDVRLAYNGPGDASIDAALANDQRHESGLARLGAVRHR